MSSALSSPRTTSGGAAAGAHPASPSRAAHHPPASPGRSHHPPSPGGRAGSTIPGAGTGSSGGGALLTKRQQTEKLVADFEKKTRQLQVEVAEWKLKHRDAEKRGDEERKAKLKVEEQLSQSGTYLKNELAKAAAEQKKMRESLESKHAAERTEWEERLRRDETRRRAEEESRLAAEKVERESFVKARVREAEERAVREYESQYGKAFTDQEEKIKESQEIIRKFRDDLVDKSQEQKKLLEATIVKDRQIQALREQHEFDSKQLKIAKTVEANLLRHKSLVKYLSLYKYIKDHQLRKKVIAIHASTLDLVGMLIKSNEHADGALLATGGGAAGAGGTGVAGADTTNAVDDRVHKQSEIDEWYKQSRVLAKHFSANKLLIALGDAQHVLAVTLRDVMDQLTASRQEVESMLERVSDLTNIALAHEHEQERLINKNRSERAKYAALQEAYTTLDRSFHSLQKKMSQMVEYAQLHSGRTPHHHTGTGPITLSGVTTPAAGGDDPSSQQPRMMTSTTSRVPPSNPFLAASLSGGGAGSTTAVSTRAQSPVRAGSSTGGGMYSPRSSGNVPAHMHFARRSGGGGGVGTSGGSSLPRSVKSASATRPTGAAAAAGESTKEQSDDQPVSSAVAAASWLTPSKPKSSKPAPSAANAANEEPPAAAEEEEDDGEAADRAAAARIAELKAWLSRAGKLKPKLWQSSPHYQAQPHQMQHAAIAPSPPPGAAARSRSPRPGSAATYEPRTYPTDSSGEPLKPHKLRVGPPLDFASPHNPKPGSSQPANTNPAYTFTSGYGGGGGSAAVATAGVSASGRPLSAKVVKDRQLAATYATPKRTGSPNRTSNH